MDLSLSAIARDIFNVLFELSPIVFVDNSGTSLLKYQPIVLYTQIQAELMSLLSGEGLADKAFCRYKVLAGGDINSFGIPDYPVANIEMGASTTIKQPRTITIIQTYDTGFPHAMLLVLATVSAIANRVDNHVANGGSFHIFTPAQAYLDCLLVSVKDVSDQVGVQMPQTAFAWTFKQLKIADKPPISLSDIMKSLTSKIKLPSL